MSLPYLLVHPPRARWMRAHTVQLLKRFFFCERALLISSAARIPHFASIEIKIGLARAIWQSAESANSLRNRVFELRFPSRVLEQEGTDAALIQLFVGLQDSPSTPAFLMAASSALLPALRNAYRDYLQASDPIADGPSRRFLSLALSEKDEQLQLFQQWTDAELAKHPELRCEAEAWARQFSARLRELGGVGIEPASSIEGQAPLSNAKPCTIPDRPARDPRYWPCRFYWPDIVDPNYPYGEGLQLQLRSAISHINEVWAIESGGIILSAFASVLPWDWIHDSARWTYDESRHCQMGVERLAAWGLKPFEIPLGTYIYESASGHDPIYRLGMLYFFETKNIRHKLTRAKSFQAYGDTLSEHDMDFDWADETIHAGYGKRWLKELLAVRGEDPAAHDQIRERCGQLVSEFVSTATPVEVADLKRVASNLIARAAGRA